MLCSQRCASSHETRRVTAYLTETISLYFKLLKLLKLFKTTFKNYLNPTYRNLDKLFRTIWNFWNQLETFKNYWNLTKTFLTFIKNYQKLSEKAETSTWNGL